jgi:hypothetical protein
MLMTCNGRMVPSHAIGGARMPADVKTAHYESAALAIAPESVTQAIPPAADTSVGVTFKNGTNGSLAMPPGTGCPVLRRGAQLPNRSNFPISPAPGRKKKRIVTATIS